MSKITKVLSIRKPMIVTYSYSWMYFFKRHATIIVRFNVEYYTQPIMASNEDIIAKITEITHHKVKQIIDHC